MNINIILISSLALGSIAAYIAARNDRNPYAWFLVGFVSGLLGILTLFFITQSERKKYEEIKPSPRPFIEGPAGCFWYYLDGKRAQQGPMSHKALTEAWHDGSIGSQTFVWHEELPNWKPLQELIKFKEFNSTTTDRSP